MKKSYEKPILTKREMLSRATAQQAPSEPPPPPPA
ncbi:putative RiPP precursor [Mesorhizobium sp. VK25A]|uniref:RiPP n=1 Tax=Mesorhizobium vachelliae TaxID=3072309 RepID=A0ABU4ZZN9_9HYPH|nr:MULTISPECIES: putative RiPP precursor [unclassified Mesorhizobium]MDX8529764.1 putative RiPP precursor [Mesorhizobium sp. VK25D]MDX8544162.1 putative RiPP precursor [Mesorhizobium sp. VK25A]